MSFSVPHEPTEIEDADQRVGMPVSSLRVGLPAALSAAHQMGDVLGGLRGYAYQETPLFNLTTSVTLRWSIWRDPQCDYVDVWVLFDTQTPGLWTCQVGGGAVQFYTIPAGTAWHRYWKIFRCPWNALDSNYQSVVLTSPVAPNATTFLRAYACIDVPRRALDSGDNGPTMLDRINTATGIIESRAVAKSNTAGPDGLVEVVRDTWDAHRRHAIIWSVDQQRARQIWTGAFMLAPVFPIGFAFPHRARARRDAPREVERYYVARASMQASAATTIRLQVTTSRGAFFVDTAVAMGVWTTLVLNDIRVATSVDDTILVEVYPTTGGTRLDLAWFSMGEAPIPDV